MGYIILKRYLYTERQRNKGNIFCQWEIVIMDAFHLSSGPAPLISCCLFISKSIELSWGPFEQRGKNIHLFIINYLFFIPRCQICNTRMNPIFVKYFEAAIFIFIIIFLIIYCTCITFVFLIYLHIFYSDIMNVSAKISAYIV